MSFLVHIPLMLLASTLARGDALVARDATTYTQNAACTKCVTLLLTSGGPFLSYIATLDQVSNIVPVVNEVIAALT
jgi:hypothetical protein